MKTPKNENPQVLERNYDRDGWKSKIIQNGFRELFHGRGNGTLEKRTGKIHKWTKAPIKSKLLPIKNRDFYLRKGQINVVE